MNYHAKWLSTALLCAGLLTACSGDSYDDSKLWDKVNSLESRVLSVEGMLTQMNTDLRSMGLIVNALNEKTYVRTVTTVKEGVYLITFSDNSSITIESGGDGADGHTPYIGANGNWWLDDRDTGVYAGGTTGRDATDGRDAIDGKDGLTPYVGSNGNWWIGNRDTGVSVRQYGSGSYQDIPIITMKLFEGRYYWIQTLNGVESWLLDNNGNKIPVNGDNGFLMPIIRVDSSGYWVISYDRGVTFDHLTYENGAWVSLGEDCQCTGHLFRAVYVLDDYLVLILEDGTVIQLRLGSTGHLGGGSSASDEYFTPDGDWVWVDGDIPTGDGTPVYVDHNGQSLPGGTNTLTVTSQYELRCIYISIEGVRGYYVFYPKGSTVDYAYIYRIMLLFSQHFQRDIHVFVGGLTTTGIYLQLYDFWIYYHAALTGALQVSLSFDTPKDIDLHVITPAGVEYYYGNRGGYTMVNGQSVQYGLDVDSNAGCNIDNINNENISFPEQLVEDGVYTVRVNQFSNCDKSRPCNWSVVATYGGQRVTNMIDGGNPVSGTYTANSGTGDKQIVMQFRVEKRYYAPLAQPQIEIVPIAPTDMDLMKMEEASWRESSQK